MHQPPRLFAALDTEDLGHAITLVRALMGVVDGFKLGLEFFAARGPTGVERVAAFGLPIFLDLKLHDIPNTVAGAMRRIAGLGVAMTTIHAAGGGAMIAAAAQAAREAAGELGARGPAILAVTVLTSLGEADLAAIGCADAPAAQVARLAALAMASGADGVVASGHEAAALRAALGPGALLVVPGIRSADAAADDQTRVMTPARAVTVGANVLVVGRPITRATDPADAARRLREEMMQGFNAGDAA